MRSRRLLNGFLQGRQNRPLGKQLGNHYPRKSYCDPLQGFPQTFGTQMGFRVSSSTIFSSFLDYFSLSIILSSFSG